MRRELGIPDDAVVVGTVGNLRPAKGHQDLVQAMAALPETVPKPLLVIAGAGELEQTIRQAAADSGMSDRLMLLGRRNDIPKVLGAFDLFVLSSRREGFPVAILEAMSAGIPIVATDVGGVGEAILNGRTGRLVPAANPAALSQAIESGLSNPDVTAELAGNGLKLFHNEFTDKGMAEGYERLYSEVLGLPR
jgi:glycosyltransferase involved in cell wall biosynthesis